MRGNLHHRVEFDGGVLGERLDPTHLANVVAAEGGEPVAGRVVEAGTGEQPSSEVAEVLHPLVHCRQRPQDRRNEKTTWSPLRMSVVPGAYGRHHT